MEEKEDFDCDTSPSFDAACIRAAEEATAAAFGSKPRVSTHVESGLQQQSQHLSVVSPNRKRKEAPPVGSVDDYDNDASPSFDAACVQAAEASATHVSKAAQVTPEKKRRPPQPQSSDEDGVASSPDGSSPKSQGGAYSRSSDEPKGSGDTGDDPICLSSSEEEEWSISKCNDELGCDSKLAAKENGSAPSQHTDGSSGNDTSSVGRGRSGTPRTRGGGAEGQGRSSGSTIASISSQSGANSAAGGGNDDSTSASILSTAVEKQFGAGASSVDQILYSNITHHRRTLLLASKLDKMEAEKNLLCKKHANHIACLEKTYEAKLAQQTSVAKGVNATNVALVQFQIDMHQGKEPSSLLERVAALTADNEKKDAEIADLKAALALLEEEVAALKTELASLKPKREK
mmetsp:Transcript_18837/g.30367  ORF Transcript_18837/g.30367 Transcript_18837/m.30367 type:complete len:403 (+) Transcript_18837:462-1670(+)|eukprot:CAMPEP_0178748266 /NCGR_PEP_ID=MMETSP0744-20121128/8793_1 /TAXON_ID=913974 /ORGANISM="Nitzschia punctata, Strain CCMP561" /LENGTH=402 /DNA_ID=CAMNT_0020401617 /DNA_START=468 /DNA_END=1676 /DNA_ORIENTATION=+